MSGQVEKYQDGALRWHAPANADDDYQYDKPGSWRLELPHSCDAWVIGSYEDAARLLRDLNAALANWPTEPPADAYSYRSLDGVIE